MNDLERRIKSIATVPILLVASDYDGTISPIVTDPAMSAPGPIVPNRPMLE